MKKILAIAIGISLGVALVIGINDSQAATVSGYEIVKVKADGSCTSNAACLQQLQDQINSEIQNGWQPYQSLMDCSGWPCQALVKYADNK